MADCAVSSAAASDRMAELLAQLPAEYRATFRRFARELLALIDRDKSWRLFIGVYEHVEERERIASAIEALLPGSRRYLIEQVTHPADWFDLEKELVEAARDLPAGAVVQVFGLERWLDPLDDACTSTRLRAANLRRDAFAREANVPLVCWLRPAQLREWVKYAPDLWSWRSGVHSFVGMVKPAPIPSDARSQPTLSVDIGNLSAQQRRQRIEDLAAYLNEGGQQPASALRLGLMDELADLLFFVGEPDQALEWRQQRFAPMAAQLDDTRALAVNRGKIADILQARGELDEALRIRRQEELPVYEKLGDVRSKAVTQGKIADILQARGEWDEALRIRRQEQLPVYERLGDVRAKSITLFKIACSRLAKNEHATQDGLQNILENLHEAYEIAARMRFREGISAIGPPLAQLLIMEQDFEPALQVLAQVDEACAVLGNEAGRQQAAALRQQIEAMRGESA